MPRVEWNQPPDRSTAVVCAMTVHIHPVTFAAALLNALATSPNTDPATCEPTDPNTSPASQSGFQ